MPDAGPTLIQPRSHKASVVTWSCLSVTDMDQLEVAVTAEQIKGVLAGIFDFQELEENPKSAILLDLFYYTIQFARDQGFSKEQTSAFFSILKKTHDVNIETPFGNVEHCFSYFKELVLCHAVKRPPFSVYLFSAEEVRRITEYVVNTYFRNIKLYKYVFTPQVRLDLSMTYEGMPETPAASEAGEVGGEVLAEDETGEATEETSPPEGSTEEQPQAESAAASELRTLVRQQVMEEIERIKTSLDGQLKSAEESMNEKLASLEAAGGKTGKGSAKGKKK